MDNKSQALAHITDALKTLDQARGLISQELINCPTSKSGRDMNRSVLEDLHKRVTQAITVLPHGGRDTANSTKGPIENEG